MQSTTVQLFQAYGVAVAPVPGKSPQPRKVEADFVGRMSFSGRFSGTLTLGLPCSVLGLIPVAPKEPHGQRDWTRELTNQLMGRVKKRMMQFQVVLQVGLPLAMTGEAFARQGLRPGETIYAFRTLRGQFFVAIDGNIDPDTLIYSTNGENAEEGDVILF